MRDFDAGVWHGFLPGIGVGQAYRYRVTGPYNPCLGPRAAGQGTLAGPAAAGQAADKVAVGPRSLVVLRSPRPDGG